MGTTCTAQQLSTAQLELNTAPFYCQNPTWLSTSVVLPVTTTLPVVLLACPPHATPSAAPVIHAVPNRPVLGALHFPLCALAPG